jgi:hypothetical protein
MYRAPISSGRDAIGMAIGGGLSAIGGGVAEGMAERRRRQLEQEEIARRDRLEQEARERADRAEAQAAQERAVRMRAEGLRLVPREQAYGVVDESGVPASLAARLPGRVAAPTRGALREGVEQVGNEYIEIDPTISLSFAERRALLAEARAEEERQLERRVAQIMGLNPGMSRGEAEARAAGISIADPITPAQRLAQMEAEARIASRFRGGGGGGGGDRVEDRRRRELATRGYVETAVGDSVRYWQQMNEERRRRGEPEIGQEFILQNARARLRGSQGMRGISEGEIQGLVLDSFRDFQTHERRMEPPRGRGGDDPVSRLRAQMGGGGGADEIGRAVSAGGTLSREDLATHRMRLRALEAAHSSTMARGGYNDPTTQRQAEETIAFLRTIVDPEED